MDKWSAFILFMWAGIAGVFVSLLCLILNGAGDDPDSFRTYVLSSAIVLGSSLIALALTRGRRD